MHVRVTPARYFPSCVDGVYSLQLSGPLRLLAREGGSEQEREGDGAERCQTDCDSLRESESVREGVRERASDQPAPSFMFLFSFFSLLSVDQGPSETQVRLFVCLLNQQSLSQLTVRPKSRSCPVSPSRGHSLQESGLLWHGDPTAEREL